jgi:hypothetical protein
VISEVRWHASHTFVALSGTTQKQKPDFPRARGHSFGSARGAGKRTGFAIPFRLNLARMAQFAVKPAWAINYFSHEKLRLPQLDSHGDMGSRTMSISRYFIEMLEDFRDQR